MAYCLVKKTGEAKLWRIICLVMKIFRTVSSDVVGPFKNHSIPGGDCHFMDIWEDRDIFGYIVPMHIPVIWDVFWVQPDLFAMLVRTPNTLSRKNRNPKKTFLDRFG